MLDGDTLDAARQVERPAHRIDGLLVAAADALDHGAFLGRQVAVPAQMLEHRHVELRISVADFRVDRIAALRQQRLVVAIEPEARPEGRTAVLHRKVRVVERMGARIADFRRSPARPRKAVVVTAHLRVVGRRAQRHQVELGLVGHVGLQPLGALPGIAGGPAAAVDLAQDGLRGRLHGELALNHLVVLEHLLAEAELHRQTIHRGKVVVGLKDRLDDLLAPLQRSVGGRARARGLQLRADRQQVGIVRALVQRREGRGVRIAHHQQVERVHAGARVLHARHGVAAVAEDHHRLDIVALVDLFGIHRRGVEPAGRGDARHVHVLLSRACLASALGRHLVEAPDEIVVRHVPDARPVLPGARRETVVQGQVGDIEPEVGRSLHVAVAAEDVGPGAVGTAVAGGEQQVAVSPHVGGADRVLGAAHAPDEGRGPLGGEDFRDPAKLRFGHAGDALDFGRVVFLHHFAHLVHAPDALGDVVRVLPAVLEDVPHDAPDHRDVGARPETHVVGGVGRGTGEARV